MRTRWQDRQSTSGGGDGRGDADTSGTCSIIPLFDEDEGEESSLWIGWPHLLDEIDQAFIRGETTTKVLQSVARFIRTSFGVNHVVITRPSTEGNDLVIEVAAGMHADALEGMHLPYTSVVGEVFRTDAPIMLENANADIRSYKPVTDISRASPVAVVPMSHRGFVAGTLGVSNQAIADTFTEEHLRILRLLAEQSALVIEYDEVVTQLMETTSGRNRQRKLGILREEEARSFFALQMRLSAIHARTCDEDLKEHLRVLVEELDEAIESLRRSAARLAVQSRGSRRVSP